jgi:hypothetical protein
LISIKKNLFWILFAYSIQLLRDFVSREYNGCLSVLFSCYFCSPWFHRSVLGFSLRSAGRVSFSWFKFFNLPVSAPESAVSFPADYFADSTTFSLRSSLAGALFSYCCFLIPACAGCTSIERLNLCQAFGPVSSRAGRVTVAVPALGQSRDSDSRAQSVLFTDLSLLLSS